MIALFVLWLGVVVFLLWWRLAQLTESYWMRRQQWREVKEALWERTRNPHRLWVRRHSVLAFLLPFPAFIFGLPFVGILYEILFDPYERGRPGFKEVCSAFGYGMILAVTGPFEFLWEWFGRSSLHPCTWPFYLLPFMVFLTTRRLWLSVVAYVLFFLLAIVSFSCGFERVCAGMP